MIFKWNGHSVSRCVALLTAVMTLCVPVRPLGACPFCDAPAITYSEQLKEAAAVILVDWASAEKPDPFNFAPGSSTFRVTASYRRQESTPQLGESLTVPFYQTGKPGDSFWMLGTVTDEKLNWAPPVAMSRECWQYVIQAPARNKPVAERLQYYLPFLEHSDENIAIDAYGEFAGASYDHLLTVTGDLPREKLLDWLLNPETTPTRRGLYGLMLGLCGTPEDAKQIEPILLEQPRHVRLGIDGMMAGYILLTGEAGLRQLAETKLANRDIIPGESFAMLQTLRFLWEYAPQAVPRERLIEAMRLLLDHPQYAGFAVIDLARWNDWDAIPLLLERYGHGPYADSHVKESVIRFLLLAAAESSDSTVSVPPASAQAARDALARLRTTEASLIKSIERRAFD